MNKKINWQKSQALLLLGALLLSSCQNTLPHPEVQRSIAQDASERTLLEKGVFPEEKVIDNKLDSAGKMRVVFNLPPYVNPGQIGVVKEMIKTIDQAEVSLRLSIFQFNHKEIFAALERAVKRGVKVYLTTDLCYSGKEGYKEYFDALKLVLTSNGQNADTQIIDDKSVSCDTMFNHNKYMIVDYERKDLAKAWFGSFNPTNHGAVENVELAIVAQNFEMANILMLDFDQQLNGQFKVNKKGVYSLRKGNTNSIAMLSDVEMAAKQSEGFKIDYPTVSVDGMDFQFILSPKVKSLTKIVEAIYEAKSEILFSSFAIADQMLISSLINKSESVESPYNIHSILSLPHPGESEGVVFMQDGGTKKSILREGKKGPKNLGGEKELATIAQEIKETVATPVNYLTPKEEVKSVYRYFYPKGAAGGRIQKVRVEGIFNSKVINEKTTYSRLDAAGIPLYKSTLTGELHNKLFIIDEEKIIFGSHNFSQSAENSNDELTVIIKAEKLARILKNELFNKTKLFAYKKGNAESFGAKAALAITEVMPESAFKLTQKNRQVDAGEYVEIHNVGERPVNLLGFRFDDHYFPDTDNEVLGSASNPGFLGTLVRFIPAKNAGELGQTNFQVKENILPPNKTALLVGKYFHPDYYLEKFKHSFKQTYGKDPVASDMPILFTFAEYYSSVLGDSSSGLGTKDRLTLYAPDGMTVVDRFAYPQASAKQNQALIRQLDGKKLAKKIEQRKYYYLERKYSLKNGQHFLETSFLPTDGFSEENEWSLKNAGSPGVVEGAARSIANNETEYIIEGQMADVHQNKWMNVSMVIKSGKIVDVRKPLSSDKPLIKDVLVFPGLIDAHNHIKYNTMPVWMTAKSYKNRDQWPEEAVYRNGVKELYKKVYGEWSDCDGLDEEDKDKCLAQHRCEVILYGELKALIGATTSLQGSSSFDDTSSDITFRGLTPYTVGDKKLKSKARSQEDMLDACSSTGARNIEREKWNGFDEVRTTAQSINSDSWVKKKVQDPKTFSQTPSAKLINEFETGVTKTFFVHLGEGIDEVSRAEWDELTALKLNRSETTLIHATGLTDKEFKQAAAAKQSIAWSPTSNLLLYKKTTDIPTALKNKVNVALGSDWSLSGTKSLLYEIKVADMANKKYFNNQIPAVEILKMATINGARAAHIEHLIGSIEKGKLADFFIVGKSKMQPTPYETLLKLEDSGIELVFVGGAPVLGKSKLMQELSGELNLPMPLVIKDSSCKHELSALPLIDGSHNFINELDQKTTKGFQSLKPKVQSDLGQAFSKLDPLCSEGDSRMMEILKGL